MSSLLPNRPISRLRYELRHRGLAATIGEVARYARKMAYLDQTFVWYELHLGTERPRASLAPGLTLVRGAAGDIPLLEGLPTSGNEWLARRWMEAGNDLWLVLGEGGRREVVFSCWAFRGRTPVRAARGGWLELPPGVVCFEDSATSPSYRGRGAVAPGAWSRIAERLEEAGTRSVITKVEEGNKVARWAVAKAGFGEIASMRLRRVGLRQHTSVVGSGATAEWIAGQLRR